MGGWRDGLHHPRTGGEAACHLPGGNHVVPRAGLVVDLYHLLRRPKVDPRLLRPAVPRDVLTEDVVAPFGLDNFVHRIRRAPLSDDRIWMRSYYDSAIANRLLVMVRPFKNIQRQMHSGNTESRLH